MSGHYYTHTIQMECKEVTFTSLRADKQCLCWVAEMLSEVLPQKFSCAIKCFHLTGTLESPEPKTSLLIIFIY